MIGIFKDNPTHLETTEFFVTIATQVKYTPGTYLTKRLLESIFAVNVAKRFITHQKVIKYIKSAKLKTRVSKYGYT